MDYKKFWIVILFLYSLITSIDYYREKDRADRLVYQLSDYSYRLAKAECKLVGHPYEYY